MVEVEEDAEEERTGIGKVRVTSWPVRFCRVVKLLSATSHLLQKKVQVGYFGLTPKRSVAGEGANMHIRVILKGLSFFLGNHSSWQWVDCRTIRMKRAKVCAVL